MTRNTHLSAIMLMSMMASAGTTTYMPPHIRRFDPKKPIRKPTPPLPKGMKDWNIDGYHVQAVTKKAAIKKVNQLKSKQGES